MADNQRKNRLDDMDLLRIVIRIVIVIPPVLRLFICVSGYEITITSDQQSWNRPPEYMFLCGYHLE